MKFHVKSRRKPSINIVSLIDILCILLIFFIVTTVFKTDETVLKIDLPESSQAKTREENIEIIVIHVTEDEKVYLSDVPIAIDQLKAALIKMKDVRAGAKYALKASKNAPFGLIIKVMDAVKAAGITQLPTYAQEIK